MELTKKINPEWLEVECNGEKLGFLCAPLTSPQRLSVRAQLEQDATVGEGMMAAVRYATRGWRGITLDGQDVPFSRPALEEFFTGPLLVSLLMDLSQQIILRSALSEDERKNS